MEIRNAGPELQIASQEEIHSLLQLIENNLALVNPQGANSDELPILLNIKAILLSGVISRKDFEKFKIQVQEVLNKSSNYH